ncbi:tRNA pseudouridine(38-40) synthase TruA [Aromatoleum petrolei]|uniref:tRNA pseudouridine synthase A n=1 Tax=Aromatoleum petrolei TaxID=76116 RepID=A0ABX1ML63_9RHOO|nr:tRNA pseudouridine(38-40) synthase TruA [Aromatoleum petrolei]NMF88712.1 tRNA pseudouridine(38-40) synthase TruA [Aromatoleum petrolei]QTQ37866.1 tRNA pseudouridine synthase A [Aromatoleum petrolei]
MRIALGVEYAGDSFQGWQSQSHGRTVQDHLEAALSGMAGHPVRLHCAGRTDAGVHATAQVVHFDTPAAREPYSWVRGTNARLKGPVSVRWAVEVGEDFHARFCAVSRRYRYILYNSPVRPALLAGRVGWFHPLLDESAMVEAARSLIGWHDFSAFRAAGCQAKSPIKLMHEAQVKRDGDYIVFDFWANAFLHHMVRNLVGSLLYVGKGHFPPEWMADVLQSCDRSRAAMTFTPDGLYLAGVEYPSHWPLPDEGRIIALPRIPFV